MVIECTQRRAVRDLTRSLSGKGDANKAGYFAAVVDFLAIQGRAVALSPISYRTPAALQVPGGRGPSNWIPHFFAFEACSTATIWPFIWASSAAVCLSPPTKKAAGLKITTAAAVAKPTCFDYRAPSPEVA